MKKIFIFLGLMFVMLSSTYAQKGRQAIGFGLSYGTEIESAGLGIKYQYNITNPLRIEPSFNYFFENDNVSMLDLNVNFHYLCPVAQSVKLYPLFGLTMSNWMFDMHDLDVDWDGDHVHVDDGGNHNEFRIGVNLGAGAEFALGRNWAMNVEFIIRKSKFPQNPKRSVRFSGKRTKRSVQKRKARNTQKAETKVL